MSGWKRTWTGANRTLRELRYHLSARFGGESGMESSRRSLPIVVSLTTISERLEKLHLAVESLLRQTLKPDGLILWLPRNLANRALSRALRNQIRRGLEIRFVEEMGPYLKLIHTLKEHAGSLIATADDDTIYPRCWLEQLVKAHENEPHCVHCHRAHRMILDQEGRLLPYARWDLFAPGHTGPSFLLFPTGVGGVLYPPGALHPEIFNQAVFREICPTADDVWFKAMSLLNGVRCRKVSPFYRELPPVRGTQTRKLWRTNVLGGRNDIQLQAVFQRYDLYPRLMNQAPGSSAGAGDRQLPASDCASADSTA
jgi:hypothetical protein